MKGHLMSSQDAMLLMKITMKSIGADLSSVKSVAKDHFEVWGMANAVEVIATTFGDSEKLRGEFRAVNLDSGELFQSSSAFLPRIVNDQIAAQLKNDSGSVVKFAYRVGTRPSSIAVGYEYVVTPLLAAEPSELMSELQALTSAGSVKALGKGAGK